MFGYGYKEDALKWREHKKKLDDAELAKTARMVCKVHLVDNFSFDYELTCQGVMRDVGFLELDFQVFKAEDRIMRVYEEVCSEANSDGLHVNGSFYPHSQIKRIERGEIEVTTNEV